MLRTVVKIHWRHPGCFRDVYTGEKKTSHSFYRITSTYSRDKVDSKLPTADSKICKGLYSSVFCGNVQACRNEDSVQTVEFTRHAHTDMKWPDFSKDRRSTNKDPEMPSLEGSYTRRVLSYLPVAAALTAGIYATKTVTAQFISSMSPAKDVLALAQAEVKISGIDVGQMMTIKWRGKPLFIKRRAQADIDVERQTPLSMLRDPERDEDRVIKDEFLVVIGVCTHLGCVPISNAGDYNAFYCPCHGSHYDHSGRIRKGPAPTNLEVPPYVFLNDETILVG